MLTLKQLVVEDFGPFKGEQKIDFPEEGGITIVYGENMRGKTYFLNAIRYVLFGKVLGRGSQDVSIHRVGNWERAQEGSYGFKVKLTFKFKGHEYELIRECRPKDNIEIPENDRDYTQVSFLCRDGSVLGPGETDIELARIMPVQVSRFFLFDGELLEEYEELLRDESTMGPKITAAIERILGVPILTNARADLRELQKRAQKQESLAAQKDQKTQQLGNYLAEITEKRTYHQSELERLTGELEKLKDNRRRLEESVKKNQKALNLLEEGSKLEKAIEDTKKKLDEKEEKLKEVMHDAWRGMLSFRILKIRKLLEKDIEEFHRHITEQEILGSIKDGLKHNKCPTCLRFLDEKTKLRFNEMIKGEKGDNSNQTKKMEIAFNLNRKLEKFDSSDKSELVEEIVRSIDDFRVDIVTKQDRIYEILESLEDIDEKEIRTFKSDLDKIIKEIGIVEEGIEAEKKTFDEIEDSIRELQKELEKEGGADLKKESQRRQLFDNLFNLFAEAVNVYRDRLREKVEDDSTQLFLKLVHEQDYARLDINENYGLTIIHKDGRDIPVRSAGAEHIVALSLIGALQKNAPLQGPIIMDSPFGRLDEQHTKNVIRTLPGMTDQSLLLVYRSELDPKIARKELLGKLKTEYKMKRITARYTSIEKIME